MIHLAFMPLVPIFFVVSDADGKDAACVLRVLAELSFKSERIPAIFDLPDRFVRRMVHFQFHDDAVITWRFSLHNCG